MNEQLGTDSFHETGNDLPTESQNSKQKVDDLLGLNLNTDESKDVTKPRVRRPRFLQDTHLLSVRGLKYVRNNAQKRVRKNIQHKNEYTNLTNLLTFYQIWGHNLFPKAKFSDFLDMCATAGAKKPVRDLREMYKLQDMGISRTVELPKIPKLYGMPVNVMREQIGHELEETVLLERGLPHNELDSTHVRGPSGDDGHQVTSLFVPVEENEQDGAHKNGNQVNDEESNITRDDDNSNESVKKITDDEFHDGFHDGFHDEFDNDDDDLLFAKIGTKLDSSKTTANIEKPTATEKDPTSEEDPTLEEFDQFDEMDEHEAELEAMREYGL